MRKILFVLLFATNILFSICFEYHCDGVSPLKGFDNFLVIDDYFPMNLKIDGQNLSLSSNNSSNQQGTVVMKEDELTLDFSWSDQYSFFVFPKELAQDILSGKLEEIKGTWEDGFDWSNGYNTRAQFSVICHKKVIQ
jgi:hypothetical protein